MNPSIVYRLRQFQRAVGARATAQQRTSVRVQLSEAQWRLFRGMSPRDQWHAVETLRLLGPTADDKDVAVAALLHDVGKGYIRLPERVLFVLTSRYPLLLTRLAAQPGSHWRTALFRSMHHAEAGAAMALAAGSSERTAALIRNHHLVTTGDAAARALRAADDRA